MRTFTEFESKLKGRARKLANNTYIVAREDGGIGVRLHDTEVVVHYPDHIVLNSGGWQTVTTKQRMNEFSEAFVWSKKGVWMLSWYDRTVTYADHICLYAAGAVTGAGLDPKATQKLRKRVNTFAKDYAAAFIAGNVPAPSDGDCWPCCMVTKNGTGVMGGADHILSHLDENYFVPSILNRMADSGTLSLHTKDFIARTWSPDHETPTGWGVGIASEQITKAVRKFCFRELGLSS